MSKDLLENLIKKIYFMFLNFAYNLGCSQIAYRAMVKNSVLCIGNIRAMKLKNHHEWKRKKNMIRKYRTQGSFYDRLGNPHSQTLQNSILSA